VGWAGAEGEKERL